MTTTYDFGNAGPGFVHAHIFYVRLLSWNWCPSSLSDSACRTSRLRIAMFYWEKKYYFDRCLPMGCRTSKESVIQKLKLFIQLCEKKTVLLTRIIKFVGITWDVLAEKLKTIFWIFILKYEHFYIMMTEFVLSNCNK